MFTYIIACVRVYGRGEDLTIRVWVYVSVCMCALGTFDGLFLRDKGGEGIWARKKA